MDSVDSEEFLSSYESAVINHFKVVRRFDYEFLCQLPDEEIEFRLRTMAPAGEFYEAVQILVAQRQRRTAHNRQTTIAEQFYPQRQSYGPSSEVQQRSMQRGAGRLQEAMAAQQVPTEQWGQYPTYAQAVSGAYWQGASSTLTAESMANALRYLQGDHPLKTLKDKPSKEALLLIKKEERKKAKIKRSLKKVKCSLGHVRPVTNKEASFGFFVAKCDSPDCLGVVSWKAPE